MRNWREVQTSSTVLNLRYVLPEKSVSNRSTESFSNASVQAVCVEAGMIALREGFTEIGHEHYLSGILYVRFRLSPLSDFCSLFLSVYSEVQSKKKNDHVSFFISCAFDSSHHKLIPLFFPSCNSSTSLNLVGSITLTAFVHFRFYISRSRRFRAIFYAT